MEYTRTALTDRPNRELAKTQAIASAHVRFFFSKSTARKKIRIQSRSILLGQYEFLPLLAWPFGLWIGSR